MNVYAHDAVSNLTRKQPRHREGVDTAQRGRENSSLITQRDDLDTLLQRRVVAHVGVEVRHPQGYGVLYPHSYNIVHKPYRIFMQAEGTQFDKLESADADSNLISSSSSNAPRICFKGPLSFVGHS